MFLTDQANIRVKSQLQKPKKKVLVKQLTRYAASPFDRYSRYEAHDRSKFKITSKDQLTRIDSAGNLIFSYYRPKKIS